MWHYCFYNYIAIVLACFLLCYRAVDWGYYLISVANRVAKLNILPHFFLYENKNNKEMQISFWGTTKIGNQEHFYFKHY